MTTDPREIAKRLTTAQRRAIMILNHEFKTPPRGHAYWAGSMLSGPRLTEFRYVKAGDRAREYRLNTLGLAVRDVLMEEG